MEDKEMAKMLNTTPFIREVRSGVPIREAIKNATNQMHLLEVAESLEKDEVCINLAKDEDVAGLTAYLSKNAAQDNPSIEESSWVNIAMLMIEKQCTLGGGVIG